jgi:1-acyl-sn-glycerol-3-phosphate acyltransferase
MATGSTRTNAYWNTRPNTTDNEFAPCFFRHGRRMHRFLKLICRVDFPDELKLPEGRPILFAGNHRSFLDVLVAGAVFSHLQMTCRFQVQARMFDRPMIGSWLTNLGCIPTNRAVREQAEDTTVATLEAGHTAAVMPEGRLVPPGDRPNGVGPGRPGLSRITARTGALVIPVACHGSDQVWPRGRPFPKLGLFRRRTVSVRFGEPMELTGDDHQQNVDAVMARIAEMLEKRPTS